MLFSKSINRERERERELGVWVGVLQAGLALPLLQQQQQLCGQKTN